VCGSFDVLTIYHLRLFAMSINTYLYINLGSIPSKARYTKGSRPGRLINPFFVYIECLMIENIFNSFKAEPHY